MRTLTFCDLNVENDEFQKQPQTKNYLCTQIFYLINDDYPIKSLRFHNQSSMRTLQRKSQILHSYRPKKCIQFATKKQSNALIIIIIIIQYQQTKRMSDSDLSSQKQKPQKSQVSLQKQRSIARSISSRVKPQPQSPPPPPVQKVIEDQTGLYQENRKLRRKLKELSMRLDQQLQKAADSKLKRKNDKNGHPVSIESQNLQLQNAYKMIERLQKAVKDYESKESYQVTLKRVMDLEGIIKKKDREIDDLKTEVKTQKKMVKDKEKHIEQLIQNSKKMGNPTQDLQMINKLKMKMKKIAEDNDSLRKKQLQKHEKLVKAQRRLIEMQQNDRQMPIASDQNLLKEVDDFKAKYKEALQRIQRQNIYINKLNEKLNRIPNQRQRRSEKQSQRRNISMSLDQLPQLKKKINPIQLLDHLPSPKDGKKLKRY